LAGETKDVGAVFLVGIHSRRNSHTISWPF